MSKLVEKVKEEYWSIVEKRLISFYGYEPKTASDAVDRLKHSIDTLEIRDMLTEPKEVADDIASGERY
jgi:hypothetical protein